MDGDIFYRLLPSMSYSAQEQILLNACCLFADYAQECKEEVRNPAHTI